jgi:hypothetical protein
MQMERMQLRERRERKLRRALGMAPPDESVEGVWRAERRARTSLAPGLNLCECLTGEVQAQAHNPDPIT